MRRCSCVQREGLSGLGVQAGLVECTTSQRLPGCTLHEAHRLPTSQSQHTHLGGKVAGLDRLRAQDDVVAVVAGQRARHVAQLDHVDAAAGQGRGMASHTNAVRVGRQLGDRPTK